MTVETIGEALPGAHVIEAYGEFSEDWVPTLRVQRVLDATGQVLYDVDDDHSHEGVEEAVKTVNVEYLDVLIDITGGHYMGQATIG